MEELQNISTYEAFKAATDREVLNQAEGFVRLGYLLRKARDTEILRDSGYPSVVEFAQGEYGLTETYVSRYIAINKRYSEDGYSPYLKERFRGYGMAKLAEMLTLSDEVVEALPAELPKAVVQEVKREIRQEQEITDLEVMLEEEEDEARGKSNLEKWMQVYFRENQEEGVGLKEREPETNPADWAMDVLAPTGIAAKMARVKGVGKFMLAIKSRYLPVELLNVRTNEKETYSLEECASVMEAVLMQSREKAGESESRGEKEGKLAPVQETEDKTAGDDRETAGAGQKIARAGQETALKAIEKGEAPKETKPEEGRQEERQMEVEDYPELLPDGYVPSSAYIQCHDGSEVVEKEWKEAEDLIWDLHCAVMKGGWNLEEVYQRAEKLLEVLRKLRGLG